MKKLLSVLLSSMMVMSMAACGQTTNEGSQPAPTTPEGKEKIVAWAWDKNFNVAALEVAKAEYEKTNPNVEIEIVEFAQADIVQKLNAGLGSGTTEGLPNIVLIEDYRSPTFLKSFPGEFADLTAHINYDNFANFKKDFAVIDGKHYNVPFDAGTAVLYYRLDLIEQAGYTEEDMKDLTWDEYIEIGVAVKEKTGVHMLTMNPNDIGEIRIMMQSASTWYVKEDGVTPHLADNAPLKAALEVYKKMVDTEILLPNTEWSQFVGNANSGAVATVPTGCWFTPSIAQEESQSGNWRVAPIPVLADIPNSVHASNLGGSSWYVINDVPGTETAIDFLAKTFGGSDSLYETLLTEKGIISTYLPVTTSEAYQSTVAFWGEQSIYSDIAEITAIVPAINYGLHTYAFEDITKAVLQDVIAGKDIQETLDAAQKQAESQIQ